jgi:hypothetical protein
VIAVAKAKLTAIGITDFIFDAESFVSFLPTEQHTKGKRVEFMNWDLRYAAVLMRPPNND